jgi:hypothetical protein
LEGLSKTTTSFAEREMLTGGPYIRSVWNSGNQCHGRCLQPSQFIIHDHLIIGLHRWYTFIQVSSIQNPMQWQHTGLTLLNVRFNIEELCNNLRETTGVKFPLTRQVRFASTVTWVSILANRWSPDAGDRPPLSARDVTLSEARMALGCSNTNPGIESRLEYYLFVVYSTTPFQWQWLYSAKWNCDKWMIDLKVFGRKRPWPNFKVLYKYSPGRTKENHKKHM